MNLLGIDIGTTHCKAGLFSPDGTNLALASRPMNTRSAPAGYHYYDPEELWRVAAATITEVTAKTNGTPVAVVGIASMAETGLLVERDTGQPRSEILPWFDTITTSQAQQLSSCSNPVERFSRTGNRLSFKCSLAKILWLRERDPQITTGALWLSMADYVAMRLTGSMGTDYSLAGRTCGFRIDRKEWEADWLGEWKLSPELFPPAWPSGTPIGRVAPDPGKQTGLPSQIPVAISGHDHVCAAFAMGAIKPGKVFDSMGTAETLMGALTEKPLDEADYNSGLLYGCHASRGQYYWMGGLSASGGSVEWIRAQLGTDPLPYGEIEALLRQAQKGPTGILYFPYLLGSGSPHRDAEVRGAIVGLELSHQAADLLKAVLEGTAYEMELIRQTGERATGEAIHGLYAAGGGTRLRGWMQIKADVSGCQFSVPAMPEATLLGAALIAGIGCGYYKDEEQAFSALVQDEPLEYIPKADHHRDYQRLYQRGYLQLQAPLRAYHRQAM